jgi:hypothetical protein
VGKHNNTVLDVAAEREKNRRAITREIGANQEVQSNPLLGWFDEARRNSIKGYIPQLDETGKPSTWLPHAGADKKISDLRKRLADWGYGNDSDRKVADGVYNTSIGTDVEQPLRPLVPPSAPVRNAEDLTQTERKRLNDRLRSAR